MLQFWRIIFLIPGRVSVFTPLLKYSLDCHINRENIKNASLKSQTYFSGVSLSLPLIWLKLSVKKALKNY